MTRTLKSLLLAIDLVVGFLRSRWQTNLPVDKVAVEAYCADCGGATLLRNAKTLRIYCPQCNRDS